MDHPTQNIPCLPSYIVHLHSHPPELGFVPNRLATQQLACSHFIHIVRTLVNNPLLLDFTVYVSANGVCPSRADGRLAAASVPNSVVSENGAGA